MMRQFLFLFLSLAITSHGHWLRQEERLIANLDNHEKDIADQVIKLKKFHQVIVDQHTRTSDLDNPINGFLLAMRATMEWQEVREPISPSINLVPNLPSRPILFEPIQAMVQLQKVYNLTTISMVNNILKEKSDDSKFLKMKSIDCYLIAIEYFKLKEYKRAIEWFQVAQIKVSEDGLLNPIHVLTGLETAFYKSGQIKDAFEIQSKVMEAVPMLEKIIRKGCLPITDQNWIKERK